MNEMFRYGVVLGIICCLSGGVLAVVNAVTQPQIIRQAQENEQAALKKVLPEAARFDPYLDKDKAVYYTAYDEAGKISGFVVKSKAKGYSSEVEVMAGLNLKLEIVNARVLSQNETPGLGVRITENDFLSQFAGKTLDSMDKIIPIAGATISSTAAVNGLKEIISQLKPKLLEEIKNAK
jgi:electron transport complex protein RnfG